MGAVILSSPELEITKEEAKTVGEAAADVASYYSDIEVNAKAAAWFNLALALGSVYGTRLVVVARKGKKKPGPEIIQPKQATPATPSVFGSVINGMK